MNFDFITCVDYQKLNNFINENYYNEEMCVNIVSNLIRNGQAPNIFSEVLMQHLNLVHRIPEFEFELAITNSPFQKDTIMMFYFNYVICRDMNKFENMLSRLTYYHRAYMVNYILFRDDIPPLSANFWLNNLNEKDIGDTFLRHCKYMNLYEDLFWKTLEINNEHRKDKKYYLCSDFKYIPEDFRLRIKTMVELTED